MPPRSAEDGVGSCSSLRIVLGLRLQASGSIGSKVETLGFRV